MAATSVKAIRCSNDDLEHNRLLRLARGEDESESEVLLAAMRVGLRLLAVQARAPGEGQYAGYDPAALAHRLRIDILPVLDFLAEQGQLPAPFSRAMIGPGEPMGSVGDQAAALPAAPVVSTDATGAVLALSGGFLDDED